MQNITDEFLRKFISETEIPYIATQPKLCIPIILRICKKMAHSVRFDDIKICENLIIDGHHRYLSSLIMGSELGRVLSNSTSATVVIPWHLVEFDKQDWDTPAKIAHLNELDAKYNGLQVEFINQITFD